MSAFLTVDFASLVQWPSTTAIASILCRLGYCHEAKKLL
jgi:hypothetical protein